MSIRSKLLTVIFIFGMAPMLLVSIVNYVRSVRAVNGMLRDDVEQGARRIAGGVEEKLRESENDLIGFARTRTLRDYLRTSWMRSTAKEQGQGEPSSLPVAASSPGTSATGQQTPLPHELLADIDAFYRNHQDDYASITCLNAERQTVFRAEGILTRPDGTTETRIETQDFVRSSLSVDPRVWTAAASSALRSPVSHEQFGEALRATVPVFLEEGETGARGALVAELKLDAVFKRAEAGYASVGAPTGASTSARGAGAPSRLVVALDGEGRIVYHSGYVLKNKMVADEMPFFQPIAERMRKGASGVDFYEDKATDGDRWLAAYRPVEKLGVSVAVARNYSYAVSDLQRAGLSGVALLLLAALIAAVLTTVLVGRTAHRIERVAAGAAAIAGGDLNQRIDIQTSDETHVLAESFNRMSDRLREQITREAESRQFESFMRLSAMLTHDLKNSITALSMLVSNMEKQFHREEFRADAILSLREATEKLKRIVARLSEPVKSLSGEYRRDARPVDLVPVIRRVVASTVEPSAPLYEVEMRLPESLVGFVEEGRIENVIENLVINALESMGAKGGRLTIDAGEEPSGMVFFQIADTGIGMSEEFIKMRLFRAFATTKNKGIGLGLFTCREIVEVHGGRLDVESKLGAGTRFRVVLPSKPFTLRERLQQSQKSGQRSGATTGSSARRNA